ncbi:MAG: SDR family NAD(P)-dependent oxidoreductase [Magnetococcales bacterium]|nr:SDR family NAD(P)-dependent oxidoreductase [Magnetococcales bacterium]
MNSKISDNPWLWSPQLRPQARLRLFCFPHGGGGASAFREWSQGLPLWVEVIAINPPGRGSRMSEPPLSNLDEWSDNLLKDLSPWLNKPFAFFGHSLGSITALTVTKKLLDRGETTPLRLMVSAHAGPSANHDGSNSIYSLNNEELWASVIDLGLIPVEYTKDRSLQQVILKPLRADYKLVENFLYKSHPLPIPITAFGGKDDATVTKKQLEKWQLITSANFSLEMFDGGHFYTQTNTGQLTQTIAATLQDDLSELPPGILRGPVEPYPEKCLHQLFSEQVIKTPDSLAVVDEKNSFTFAELEKRSDKLARYILQKGCGVDRLVAIFMEHKADYVTAMLAILKAGGAFLPIETASPVSVVAQILKSTDPLLVLTDSQNRPNLPKEWHNTNRAVPLDEGWQDKICKELIKEASTKKVEANPPPGPDSLAYGVLTSGTTGAPKTIICPHRGSVNSYYWRFRHLPYKEGEREACNIFFVWESLRPLLQGFPVYVVPDLVMIDPTRLMDFLEKHQITRILFTPSLLKRILERPLANLSQRLSSLRYVYLNGEVVSTPQVQQFYELLPDVQLVNDYSISECHDICTTTLKPITSANPPPFAAVGAPMSNVEILVLDEEQKPLPFGVAGEIYVGGDSLARGYLNLPEQNAQRFIANPNGKPGSRIFHTGDGGVILPSGELEIHGRTTFMIKLRGYSIVPDAVESAILAMDDIAACVAVPKLDQDTKQPIALAAYLLPSNPDKNHDLSLDPVFVAKHAPPTAESRLKADVRNFLQDKLPHYAIPTIFVVLDKLPICDRTGKLDRKSLPPLPENNKTEAAPKRAINVENRVADLWEKHLNGNRPTRPNDNFFDLGGDSLIAIELGLDIEDIFNIQMGALEIYANPTWQEMAAIISGNSTIKQAPIFSTTQSNPSSEQEELAIVGMSGRFPGAKNISEFWQNLIEETNSFHSYSDEELLNNGIPPEAVNHPDYVKVGAAVKDADQFDVRFWGLSNREAALMDPQHRLFLECCWETLESAGYAPRNTPTTIGRVGVFAGCYLPSYLIHTLKGGGLHDFTDPTAFHLTEIGNDKDYLTSRSAYLLNLSGPAVTVQTSCSTGLVAVANACQAVLGGQCEAALAGASSLTFPRGGYQYVKGHISSPDGMCRSFDAKAEGTILGEGVGVVLIKKLSKALEDGDNILAVVKGFSYNNDGSAKGGYSAPSKNGQVEMLQHAYANAKVSPDSISFIEAHGTGTVVGDPLEIQALTQVFKPNSDKIKQCAVGSIKPNMGHANIAAGVVGLCKAVLALHNKKIPANLNFQHANPKMYLESSPFYIPTSTQDWPSSAPSPKRAAVTSLGIGGTNCHMILEEAPTPPKQHEVAGSSFHIMPISGKTPQALEDNYLNLKSYLKHNPQLSLAQVAYTLAVGRETFPCRITITAQENESALKAINSYTGGFPKAPERVDGVVFLFPGQGSQHLGMGAELFHSMPIFRNHAQSCLDLFAPLIGSEIHSLFFKKINNQDNGDWLQRANYLQPALFTVEYALACTLIEFGIKPNAVSGHSLGEYVAACIAGIITLKDAVELVAIRGKAMADCPTGAMLWAALSEEEALPYLNSYPQLAIGAVNSPQDTVFSGAIAAINELAQLFEKQGVTHKLVGVNRAFHSPFMEIPSQILLEKAKATKFSQATIPITSNLTGGWMADDKPLADDYWSKQMTSTVRFGDNMLRHLETGEKQLFLEVGPGQTLIRTLMQSAIKLKQNKPDLVSFMRHVRQTNENDVDRLYQGLGSVWRQGIDLNWSQLFQEQKINRVSLPTYAFQRSRCWYETPKNQKNNMLQNDDATLSPKHRCFFPSWHRSLWLPPLIDPDSPPQSWLLFLDTAGTNNILGQKIAAKLAQAGHKVETILPPKNSPLDVEFFTSSLAKLSTANKTSCRILFALTPQPNKNEAESTANFFNTFIQLAKGVQLWAVNTPLNIWMLTTNAVRINSEILNPVAGINISSAQVLAQENPQVACRVVDISDNQNADLNPLLNELLAPIPDKESIIAIRDGNRWLPNYQPLPTTNKPNRQLGLPKEVYIITGGLGRIGMKLTEFLGKRGCYIAISSRNNREPTQEQQQLFSEIIKSGGKVLVVPDCDCGNFTDVKNLLQKTKQSFGNPHGIFHAAGLADLKSITLMTAQTAQNEFSAKIQGVLNLKQALAQQTDNNKTFVVLFSSLAAILGGLGMAAYAAANRFMDDFSQRENRDNSLNQQWITINWDDWDFDYSFQQTGFYEQTQAAYAMKPEEALQILEKLVQTPLPDPVVVTTRPIQPRVNKWLNQDSRGDGYTKTTANNIKTKKSISTHPKSQHVQNGFNSIQQKVAQAYNEILGVVDPSLDDNFFELGGDSLSAVELTLSLQKIMESPQAIPFGDILNFPSIRKLSENLFKS